MLLSVWKWYRKPERISDGGQYKNALYLLFPDIFREKKNNKKIKSYLGWPVGTFEPLAWIQMWLSCLHSFLPSAALICSLDDCRVVWIPKCVWNRDNWRLCCMTVSDASCYGAVETIKERGTFTAWEPGLKLPLSAAAQDGASHHLHKARFQNTSCSLTNIHSKNGQILKFISVL